MRREGEGKRERRGGGVVMWCAVIVDVVSVVWCGVCVVCVMICDVSVSDCSVGVCSCVHVCVNMLMTLFVFTTCSFFHLMPRACGAEEVCVR